MLGEDRFVRHLPRAAFQSSPARAGRPCSLTQQVRDAAMAVGQLITTVQTVVSNRDPLQRGGV
ncbi:hypothetical protein FHS20_003621 [Phyllobacterium endophyticum]|nr:hypothetical protein [Phyllobacterium endophyticum]